MFKSPIKVKPLNKQNEERQDRRFDKHLKKDWDKRKKEKREVTHHHNMEANKQRKNIRSASGMNESVRQNDKYKHIDVLA